MVKEIVLSLMDFLEAQTPDEAKSLIGPFEKATWRLSSGNGPDSDTHAPVMTPDQAEQAAADWLRSHGYDARLTGPGADEGVDVEAPGVVAQVKRWSKPVGRPDIQKLYGVASQRNAVAIFFSTEGYTKQAEEFANDVGMALLVLRSSSSVEPANQVGKFIGARTQQPQRAPKASGCLLPIIPLVVVSAARVSRCIFS